MASKFRSYAEDVVVDWLKSAGYNVIENDRKHIKSPSGTHMELDVFLPDCMFAVECDGIHYHQEKPGLSYNKWQLMTRGTDPNHLPLWEGYHKWKDSRCADQGIKCIHVSSELVTMKPDEAKAYIFEELDAWNKLSHLE